MRNQDKNEELLTGGNVSNVYRVGDTVRREVKPDSIRIHQLLQHLESKGFYDAPTFLGIDEKNREILTFIEGRAGNTPLETSMWSDEALKEIAIMLNRYHDAVSDFLIEEDWQPIDNTPQPFEVICHNDFAIYNIIFNNQKPVGIIDFDHAAPGPRLWDVAYTLYTCVPLSRLFHSETGEIIYYDPLKDADRIKQRVKLFFESYGMEGIGIEFLEIVLLRLEGLCKTITRKALEGEVAFQNMINDGHLEHYQKEIRFIRNNGKGWI